MADYNVFREDNILHDYENVTYHFRLLMADPANITRNYVIAETGATTEFNIQDVEMTHLVGPNFQTRNTNSLTGTIKIVEPLGLRFFDALFNAAHHLNIPNFQKVPYYLELTFKGYSAEMLSGTPRNLPNETKKLWRIAFKNIDTSFSSQGSEYQIEFVEFNELGLQDRFNIKGQNLKLTGVVTVKDFFRELERAINQHEFDKLTEFEFGRIFVDRYQFDISLLGDLVDRRLVSENIEKIETKRQTDLLSFSSNKQEITILGGTSIDRVVETIMISVEESAKDITVSETTGNDESETKAKGRMKTIWKVFPEVSLGQYDPFLHDYTKNITFRIVKYRTAKGETILDSKKLTEGANQKDLIKQFNVRKVYEYIYTGRNIDVLNFDFNLNLLWYSSLPLYSKGDHLPIDPGYGFKYAPPTRAVQKYKQMYDKYVAIQRDLKNESLTQDERVQKQTELDYLTFDLEDQADNVRSAFTWDNHAPNPSAIPVNGAPNSAFRNDRLQKTVSKTQSIESLEIKKSKQKPNMWDITTIPDDSKPDSEILGAVNIGARSYTTLAGSVLSQVYSNSGDLIKISLQIIGDPYWFGATLSNQEPTLIDSDKTIRQKIATYEQKDEVFLLKFKTPITKIDSQGNMSLTQSDLVSGAYTVIQVHSSFTNGQFVQNLDAVRQNLTNIKYVSEKKL